MYQHILLPTDFSQFSFQAIPHAVSLCTAFSATLHIIRVIPPVTDFVGLGSSFSVSVQTMIQEEKRTSKDHLTQIVEQQVPNEIDVQTKVLDGIHAWEGIIRYAKDNQIDLIVMTTHGTTGLKHALFGGTTEKVIRRARCPVLTIHPENDGDFQ
jgi:nucleotide-binding universal stress UspA family protein